MTAKLRKVMQGQHYINPLCVLLPRTFLKQCPWSSGRSAALKSDASKTCIVLRFWHLKQNENSTQIFGLLVKSEVVQLEMMLLQRKRIQLWWFKTLKKKIIDWTLTYIRHVKCAKAHNPRLVSVYRPVWSQPEWEVSNNRSNTTLTLLDQC